MTYELRMMTGDGGLWQLQFRTRQPVVDASGAFCGFGDWTDWSDVPTVRGGEFVDREPDHIADATKKVAQPAEPEVCDVWTDKPAELREWWVVASLVDEATVYLAWRLKNKNGIHAREVPSPERVRKALDAWAQDNGWLAWRDLKDQSYTATRGKILTLLRSLGISTEGV